VKTTQAKEGERTGEGWKEVRVREKKLDNKRKGREGKKVMDNKKGR
jgi:hypothetical protein